MSDKAPSPVIRTVQAVGDPCPECGASLFMTWRHNKATCGVCGAHVYSREGELPRPQSGATAPAIIFKGR